MPVVEEEDTFWGHLSEVLLDAAYPLFFQGAEPTLYEKLRAVVGREWKGWESELKDGRAGWMEPSTLDSALVAEVEEDTPISTSQVESAPDKSIVDTEDLQDPTKRLVSSVDGKPCIHADESSGRHSNASRSHQPSPALIKPSAEDRLPPPTNISSHPSTPTSPTHLPTAPIPLYRRRKYKPLPDPIDLPNRTSITDSNDSTTKPESGFMADISNMSTSVSSIHDDDDATDLDDDEFGTSSASVVIRDLPSVGSLTENGQLNDGKGLVFENLLLSSGDEVDGESEGGSKEERRVDEELGPSEDEDDEEDDVFFKKGVVEVPADRRSVRSFLTWTPAMGVVVVERDVDEGDEHGDGADEADIEEEDDVGGEDDAIISGGTPAPLSSSVASLGSQKVKMDVGKFPVMPSSDEVPSTRYENMITHVEGLETGKSIGSRAGSVRSEVGSHQRRRKSVSSWGKTGGRRELILEPVGVGSGTRVRGGTVAKLVERLWSPEVIDDDYISAFILSHRTFTTSENVAEILKRCKLESDTLDSSTMLAMLRFLGLWAGVGWEDFARNETLRDSLKHFVETSGAIDSIEAYNLQTFLTQRLTDKTLSNVSSSPQLPFLFSDATDDLDPSSHTYPDSLANLIQAYVLADKEAMALQITKAEAERFVAITRDELLSFGWSRMDKAIEVCPNIGRKIHTFNALSRFVTLSIVSMRSARDRGKVLKNHIRLAQSLVGSMAFDPAGKKGGSIPQNGMMSAGTRRNFDSAMAIVSALQGAAVARLKGSWKELSQKYRTAYEELCDFLSPKNNYKLLRASVRDSQSIPCIPYLGVYLQDLTFIADGNPSILSQPPPRLPNLDPNHIWIPTHSTLIRKDTRASLSTTSTTSSFASTASSRSSGSALRHDETRVAAVRRGTRQRPSLVGSAILPPLSRSSSSNDLNGSDAALINFERCWLLSKVVQDLRCRQASCLELFDGTEHVDPATYAVLSFYVDHVDRTGRIHADWKKNSTSQRRSQIAAPSSYLTPKFEPSTSSPNRSRLSQSAKPSPFALDLYDRMLALGDTSPDDAALFQMSLECEPRDRRIQTATPSSSPPTSSPLASPPSSPILKSNNAVSNARRWATSNNPFDASPSQSPSRQITTQPMPLAAAFGRRWNPAAAIVFPPTGKDGEGVSPPPSPGWKHLRVRSASPSSPVSLAAGNDKRRLSLLF